MKIKRIIALLLCCCLCAAAAAPAHAVAVADDLVIWGIVWLLSTWGITFAASDATMADVVEEMSDLLDSAGVVATTITSGAAVVAAPGILKLQPSVINAARKVALYLKDQVGGNTGTHAISQPSSGGVKFSDVGDAVPCFDATYEGYFGYSNCYYCADLGQSLPYGDYILDEQFSLQVGESSSGKFVKLLFNGNVHVADWITSDTLRDYPNRTKFYLVHWHNPSASTKEGYQIMRYYQMGNGKHLLVGNGINISAYLNSTQTVPGEGVAFSAVLDDAAIPDEDAESPVYTGAPGIGFTTPAGAGDALYNGMTGEAAYPQTATYPAQYEAENARDEAVPIVAPVGVADDYTVTGLASVFPFCIPFDLYDMFAALRANREAPSFDWRFYVPGLIDYTLTLDMAQWDTAAQILRTCELLAFCVGLALATKKLLGW